MIKDKLKIVPLNPGCYLMKNNNDLVIYVGKAKNLKNRLNSYFNGTHNGKTAKLVSEIADFEYIITNTNIEALVLELNLIKKYDPKYNIMLKDDKSYPFIELTKEKYPKLLVVRNINRKKKNTNLFGPYPNVMAARKTVNLLNRTYPLRKCNNYNKKECLYYHIEECLGYCIKEVDQDKVKELTNEITRFLKGEHSLVTKKLKEKMNQASSLLEFEKALEYKELITYIEVTLNRQKVNLNDGINRDIFGYFEKDGYLSIQVFFLRGGNLVERDSTIIPLLDELSNQLTDFISTFYEKDNIKPQEILTSDIVDKDIIKNYLNIKVLTPQKGEKKALFDLACTNALYSLDKKLELLKIDEDRNLKANQELGELIGINNLSRIEIFDNSNLFGEFSVSGMVVFQDGKPLKKEYRKYKISLDKNDDYNTMKEVIYRRYFKVLKDNLIKPDLIIVDGGINQINACLLTLNDLNLNIPVIGLKKDDKHKTSSLIASRPIREIPLDKTSKIFHLLTRIQDEVHNYTINYHKTIRSKGMKSSILDNISGIGKERKKSLLKEYKSINKLKEASLEELLKFIPKKQALILIDKLKNI